MNFRAGGFEHRLASMKIGQQVNKVAGSWINLYGTFHLGVCGWRWTFLNPRTVRQSCYTWLMQIEAHLLYAVHSFWNGISTPNFDLALANSHAWLDKMVHTALERGAGEAFTL